MKNKVFREERRRKTHRPIVVEGVFKLHPKGYAYVVPDPVFKEYGTLKVTRRAGGGAMPGDRVSCELKRRGKRRGKMVYACEVQDVLSRASGVFVGTLRQSDGGLFLFPDGKRKQSPVLIRKDKGQEVGAGDKVVVEIVQYPVEGFSAVGRVVERLGPAGDPNVEIEAVMRLGGLTSEYPEAALEVASEVAAEFEAAVSKGRFENRPLLKDETVITIDPMDAKDFDDAISIKKISKGFTLGVHIADVSHFVREGSKLDDEARKRSTSVYFPGRVVPMLPNLLSNGVCSLKEGVPRFVKSVYIDYNDAGERTETRFFESAINSSKRLTYEQAEAIRLGEEEGDSKQVRQAIVDFEGLARNIEKRRTDAGMLHLDLPEVQLVLDDTGRVADAAVKEALYSHKMIEMFMVEANEAVAELLDSIGVRFPLRVHPVPDEESFSKLEASLRMLGHAIPAAPTRKDLQELIEAVRGLPEEYAVNMGVLRSLTQAVYSSKPDGHFALAGERYCHFTSPIRRYPDLVVHRWFEKYVRGELKEAPKQDPEAVEDLAAHCTDRERKAKDVENEARQVLVLLFLSDRIGEERKGVVTGASNSGLFVQLRDILAEGMVRYDDLGEDWWAVSEKTGQVRGENTGKTFRIGQQMTVRIKSIDVARRHLDLEVV